ncbi:hypothetical protein GCM10028895_04450 [Pontibacter rugosus]
MALQEQNPNIVRTKGEPLLRKLEVTPFPGDAFTEIEIVPYEHLWDFFLKALSSKYDNKANDE